MRVIAPSRVSSDHDRSHGLITDDESLVRLSLEGCTDCFAILFHRYCKLVFAIAWKVLRAQPEAEDIVQEVFLTIFLQGNPYDASRGSVRTWIANFAQYKALMRRRHLRTRELTPLEELNAFEAGSSSGSAMERAALVEQSLLLLNPRQRRTIELIHFDGYTLAETAVLLKESLANTRNQYYREMRALRLQLRNTRDVESASMITADQTRETDAPLFLNTENHIPFPGV